MTIEVGNWVHHRPQAAVPKEQTVQVPMLVTEIDDGGWITCTFEGMPQGEVCKFQQSELAPVDDAAEKKAREEKSKHAKDVAKAKEEAAKEAEKAREEAAKPKHETAKK